MQRFLIALVFVGALGVGYFTAEYHYFCTDTKCGYFTLEEILAWEADYTAYEAI